MAPAMLADNNHVVAQPQAPQVLSDSCYQVDASSSLVPPQVNTGVTMMPVNVTGMQQANPTFIETNSAKITAKKTFQSKGNTEVANEQTNANNFVGANSFSGFTLGLVEVRDDGSSFSSSGFTLNGADATSPATNDAMAMKQERRATLTTATTAKKRSF